MMNLTGMSIEQVAAVVASHLQTKGIEVVAVGGFVAAHYSSYRYVTKDIDFVDISYQPKILVEAMLELGFTKRGKNFFHPNSEFSVEFPSGPLSVGDELISQTVTVDIGGTSLRILSASDIVKDRLAAFIHWNDNQSLEQALAIILQQNLDLAPFLEFAEKEGGSLNRTQILNYLTKKQLDL